MASFSGYTYQRQLTINHSQVSTGTLTYTNFPVLVQDTDVTLSTAIPNGHLSNPNAYDLVFSTNSDCSFLLNWDTETFNNTGSTQDNIWVNIPTISSSTDTTFYMCYGNPAITTYQSFSTGTWDSNYLAVFHFGISTSSFVDTNDSTSNRFLGVGTSTSTVGQIDDAATFNGSQEISVTNTGSDIFYSPMVPRTFSIWYFTLGTSDRMIMSNNNGSQTLLDVRMNPSAFFFTFSTPGCGEQSFVYTGAGNPLSSGWHYLSVITSGTLSSPLLSVVFDGNIQTFSPTAFDPIDTCGNGGVIFGGYVGSGSRFSGTLDESEISSISRSIDWIQTQYKSQLSPSTFLTVGSESGGIPPDTHGLSILGSKVRISGGKVRAL